MTGQILQQSEPAASDAQQLLMRSTEAMFASGMPLMNRLLPSDTPAEIWEHYPLGDVVNGAAGSRYFYHSHPPAERAEGEHGHFHIFIDKTAMSDATAPLIDPPAENLKQPRADVVHIAALSISLQGLPIAWFGVNRWVTDEWLYPAEDVIAQLDRFDMRGQNGDPLVNDWLTAMVAVSRQQIHRQLRLRDQVLMAKDPSGEDRSIEVTGIDPIDLEVLFSAE